MKHIVNENGSIVNINYLLKGKQYKIIGTQSTATYKTQNTLNNLLDYTIDTIINVQTGALKEVLRRKLYNYTRKAKPVDVYVKMYELV